MKASFVPPTLIAERKKYLAGISVAQAQRDTGLSRLFLTGMKNAGNPKYRLPASRHNKDHALILINYYKSTSLPES